MAVSHLVVLFCTTAGQNAENLGSDEEQTVSLVYLLYDIANNKVSPLHIPYLSRNKRHSRPILEYVYDTNVGCMWAWKETQYSHQEATDHSVLTLFQTVSLKFLSCHKQGRIFNASCRGLLLTSLLGYFLFSFWGVVVLNPPVQTNKQTGIESISGEVESPCLVEWQWLLCVQQVVCLQQHYVRPTKDDASTENVLTEECKAQTDLPEDDIKNAQPLEHVLDEVKTQTLHHYLLIFACKNGTCRWAWNSLAIVCA